MDDHFWLNAISLSGSKEASSKPRGAQTAAQ